MSARAWLRVSSAIAVMLVAAGFYRLVSYRLTHDFGGNYSGFLQIGRMFDGNPVLPHPEAMRSRVIVQDSDGYDGQFMYFMTFDPFLRRFHADPGVYRNVVDTPPYRYGRIGLSVLTKIVSLDRWRRYPAATMWVILSALVVCAIGISVLAARSGTSPMSAVAVLLVPAFWISVQTGLPEPVAAAFAVTGFVCVMSGKWLQGAILFACSLLVRETGVLFVLMRCRLDVVVGAAASGLAIRPGRARAARVVAAVRRPHLHPSWGTEAFFYNPHDLGLPFAGIIELWGTRRARRLLERLDGHGSRGRHVPDRDRRGPVVRNRRSRSPPERRDVERDWLRRRRDASQLRQRLGARGERAADHV